jgi:triacylglycerol lipase
MKNLIFLIILSVSTSVFAGSSGSSAKPLDGSYPVVLAHGILGFDDSSGFAAGALKYWGGMDDYLKSEGADTLTPGKTAMANLDVRAQQQKDQILYWMAANGYSKVNIIGHSQGAIDTRYMISNLGMSSKVRIYTSLNGVNHGTPVADIALGVVPNWMEPFVASVVNAFMGFVYADNEQDLVGMTESLTIQYANAVNAASPDKYGVKYYSYGSHMAWADPVQHPLMFALHPVTWTGGLFYGVGASNDGVVPESSQHYGTWKGGPDYGIFTSGIDHLQATNFEWGGQTWYDVEGYFLEMAENAMNSQ